CPVSVDSTWHQRNRHAVPRRRSSDLVLFEAPPTVMVSIDPSDVNLAAPTATVMFTFSEAPIDFSLANVTANGGTLSNFSGSGTIYTVTFTAKNGIDISNGSVSVDNNWHEGNGNAGTSGSTGSFVVDTVTPTVTVLIDHSDVNLADSNTTRLISFN